MKDSRIIEDHAIIFYLTIPAGIICLQSLMVTYTKLPDFKTTRNSEIQDGMKFPYNKPYCKTSVWAQHRTTKPIQLLDSYQRGMIS